MALEIVDLLAKRLKQEYKLTFAECKTKHTPISGLVSSA
jgi:glycerol-3-phosphate dehydrogenase